MSGPGARARVVVRCSVMATGRIVFWLVYTSGSLVSVRAILHFRIKVLYG